MTLLGGTHSFDAGLTVSTNALLTGCGTINGTVVNLGTITNDCGTLSFNGVITNTAIIVAAPGAILDFNGPLVNSGTIDAANGIVHFNSTTNNTGTILLPPQPVAEFTASPTNGATPLLVNFLDASTGTITDHEWTFGDNATSLSSSPSHTYSTAGVYSVTLTVSGPGGSNTLSRSNLITVTNTPPTVTILRPANGMLYPQTNSITVVASATANDGGAISKIEFFGDGTKIGETTSSPGTTNFMVSSTLATHTLTARATDTFGATNTSTAVMITVGAKNSPLGDWEVTISGFDKGAQFLSFGDDFSASGYGIRLKTFGLDEVSGQWSTNAAGQVTGQFVEQTDGVTNWNSMLLATVKSLKSLSGTVPTNGFGPFHWKGIPMTTSPDISGTWSGAVTVVKTATQMIYRITTNADDAAVFDIATSDAPDMVVGQLLVTSRSKVFGYITIDNQPINFSGTFSATRLSLKGTDAAGEKVTIKLSSPQ